MKKLLKGCGIIVLIGVIILIGVSIFVGLKIRNVNKQMKSVRVEMQELNQQHPFTAPPADAMNAERLNDFFTVRTAIMRVLEVDPVVIKFQGQSKPKIGFGDLTHLIFKLPQKIASEFKIQLEAKSMSPDEYTWFARTIYTTIYNAKAEGDVELIPVYDVIDENLTQFNMQIAQMNQPGMRQINWSAVVSPEINKDAATKTANRELVLQHKEQILEYPQLAFLEMMFSRAVHSPAPSVTVVEPPAGS